MEGIWIISKIRIIREFVKLKKKNWKLENLKNQKKKLENLNNQKKKKNLENWKIW